MPTTLRIETDRANSTCPTGDTDQDSIDAPSPAHRPSRVDPMDGMQALAADARVQRLAEESRHLTLVRLDLLRDIHRQVDPAVLGYSHRDDFAREELGISASAWRTSLRLSRALENLPCARAALQRGWTLESRLLTVLPELSPENEAIWIARAIRWPVAKLAVLTRHARRQRMEAESHASNSAAVTHSVGRADLEAHGAHEHNLKATGRVHAADTDAGTTAATGTDAAGTGAGAEATAAADTTAADTAAADTGAGVEAPLAVAIDAPTVTALRYRSFTEEVSRRLGLTASPGRALEVALGEFHSRISPKEWDCVQLRREWPPRFLDHPSNSGNLPHSFRVDLDDSRYVYVPPGTTQPETMPRWLIKELADRPRPECQLSPFRHAKAELRGVEPEQTDGATFVRQAPSASFSGIRRPATGGTAVDHDLWDSPLITSFYDLYISEQREQYDQDRRDAESARVTRRLAEFDAFLANRSVSGAEGAERSPEPRAEVADPRSLLRDFHEVEARVRGIRHEIADALETFRNSNLLTPLGWNGLGDYVEDRLGISLRTAYDWMVTSAGRSRLIRSADTNPSVRSTTLRSLLRLEKAGASDECLRLWIERAEETTAKVMDRQVAWALAEIDARPTSRLFPSRALTPPSWPTWMHIRSTLLRRPDLLGNATFHESVEREMSLQISAAGLADSVAGFADAVDSAAFAALVDSAEFSEFADSTDSTDSTDSAESTESAGSAGSADSANASHDVGDVGHRATLGTHPTGNGRHEETRFPFDFQIPPDSTPVGARIHLRVAPEVLEEFRRAIAILRAVYGSERPVWWCLEALILHARHDWIAADRDFRRRTAQVTILERDGFQCANPVCTSRREVNVHHIEFRSAGGSDDPSNLISICAACHLHGIHERRSIAVRGTAPDRLEWTVGQRRFEGDRIAKQPFAPVRRPFAYAPKRPVKMRQSWVHDVPAAAESVFPGP